MDFIKLGFLMDSRPVRRGKRDVDEFGRASERAGRRAKRGSSVAASGFRTMALAASAAVGSVLALGAASRTLANFEGSMAQVAAITGATGSELEALRSVAKDLGSTTEFSASQAAEGLKFLGMAGFEASESMEAIPAVLDLATAAQMDLGRAADITSNIMSGFGIEASRSSEVADILATAASSANTDVEQLGQGMKFVGPVAAAMGVSMNDAAAAMGVLADAGLQGAMGGTGLRRVLSALANATPQATKVINKLGLSMEELDPTTNSIVEIIDKLAATGLSAADALTIFGDRGGPAILALVSQNDRLRELTGHMQDVEGAAKSMADIMRDNLKGDFDALRSAAEGLIIAMGEAGLTAALRTVLQGLTTFTRFLTRLVEAVGENETAMQALKIAVVGVGTVMGGSLLLGAVKGVSGALIGLARYAITAAGAFTVLRTALMLTGFGALVVGAGYLVTKILELNRATGGWAETISALGEVWKLTVNGIVDLGRLLGEALGVVFDVIKTGWLKVMLTLQRRWADFLHDVTDGLRHLRGIVPGVEAAFQAVGQAAIAAGSRVYELETAIDQAQTASEDFFNTWASRAADAFKPALTRVAQLIGLIDKANAKATKVYSGRGSFGMPEPPGAEPPAEPDIPGIPSIPDIGGGGSGANEELRERNQLIEEAKRLTQEHASDQEKFAAGLAHLNELMSTGELSTRAYNAELKRLRQEYTGAGKAQKFLEQQMQSFKDGILDAIVKGNSLIQTMQQLAQAIAKAALQAALFGDGPFSGLFGQTPGKGLLSFIPGFAEGTKSAPGGTALVGEKGPELVNLPKGAEVIPSDRTQQMLRRNSGVQPSSNKTPENKTLDKLLGAMERFNEKEMKVNSVTVFDPAIVGQYLNSPEGEKLIVNTVRAQQEG